MLLARSWFRRRLPWVGAPPLPAPSALRHALRPTTVAPPWNRTTRGLVRITRVPRSAPVVNVAGGVPAVVKCPATRPPHRAGQVLWARPPGAPPAPVAPIRVFLLRASGATAFTLRARSDASFSLAAGARAAFNLVAGYPMSIASNLVFFQGEDVTLTWTMTPPTDVTGWTLTGTVRDKLSGTVQFTFTPTVSDAGRGVFTVSFPRSSTGALAAGDYVWDVRRTDAGKNTVLAHGEITLKQPVTP